MTLGTKPWVRDRSAWTERSHGADQHACRSDVGGAVAIGEEAVIADPREARREDVLEEAAEELHGVEELYGNYELQGGLLGQTAEGIAVHVRAQLFRPNETTPLQVFEFNGTPRDDIRFSKSFGDITSADQMRSVLLKNSYAHVTKAMRDVLLLPPPVTSERLQR